MIRKIRVGLSLLWELIFIDEILQWNLSNRVRLYFYRSSGMKVGEKTHIFRKCELQHLEGISIGDNCVIGHRCRLDGRGRLIIGNNVNVSSDTILETGSHEYSTFACIFKPIVIEDNVWVGTRTTILQGVTIGEGAIVGAGSVVTRNVDPYTIVAGVPAKPIGKRPKEISYQLKGAGIFR
jgi:acetyltransferase-like isoleucine patch superfamily enzyme